MYRFGGISITSGIPVHHYISYSRVGFIFKHAIQPSIFIIQAELTEKYNFFNNNTSNILYNNFNIISQGNTF